MEIFTGCGVAMVTAFSEDGIDFCNQKKIIEHLVASKVNAIIVCGTTGEPSTMTKKEQLELIDFTVKTVNKRVPVIAGTGKNCTASTIELSLEAQKRGADALMLVTPYYNKCTQSGLLEHYRAIADAVRLPIIVYSVPSRTNVTIQPETALQLADIKNIVAIKEASGDVSLSSKILALVRDKIAVYSGDDHLTLPLIALGAKGVISVCANVVPSKMVELASASISGDFIKARALNYSLVPLINSIFLEVSPAGIKKAMEFCGFGGMRLRPPLMQAELKSTKEISKALQGLGLL